MKIQLRVFGIEVFSLHLGDDAADILARLLGQEDEVEDDTGLVGGGSSHNFERDTEPLDPADHYGEWEFGFGRPKRVKGKGRDAPD